MNQDEKRLYLIRVLLDEQPTYRNIRIPTDQAEQKRLLRSLFNIRMPEDISKEFLRVQDEYLQEEIRQKGITDLTELTALRPGIFLWQGDITTLRCDAIVNAANSGMTGCYQPCHNCIDNCIHTYAGIQLRNYCAGIMEKQGFEEPTGQAKITPAFNLPCKYILHTVGPIVNGSLTADHEKLLASCYHSCLMLADTHTAVISFIDLYEKTRRNFPEVRAVPPEQRLILGKAFCEIGRQYGMTIKPCAEGNDLARFGADCSGCMTVQTYEKAIRRRLKIPVKTAFRKECACYLGGDIGEYNTCGHLCRYCYANYDAITVKMNMNRHDSESPLLIGHLTPEDLVYEAKQESWIDPQMSLII